MSGFNSIGAANDRIADLERAIKSLKRGDCWCEVGIGNPMCQGRHSPQCKQVTALMTEYDELSAPCGRG